ncbi:MAG: hypothetical protein PHI28_12165 [Mangrovibacterium sp.]|nr:hypothetical protein [Mangrovibacterium sp.]
MSKESVQKMFVDSGLEGLEDYISQRENYLKNFTFSGIDWNEHDRYEGELQDKIICLAYKAVHLPYQVTKSILGL